MNLVYNINEGINTNMCIISKHLKSYLSKNHLKLALDVWNFARITKVTEKDYLVQ